MPITSRVVNFAGGRNSALHPINLHPNELVEARNFYVDLDGLRPRRGTRAQSEEYRTSSLLTPTPYSYTSPLLSLYSYRDPVLDDFSFIIGTKNHFVGTRRGLSVYALDSITPDALITSLTTGVPRLPTFVLGVPQPNTGTNFGRWRFAQMKGVWYAVSETGSRLIRGNYSTWSLAGISPPAFNPVISQGIAGGMTAANYTVVATYYNSLTDDESDRGPVSNVLALASGFTININGLAPSSDPKVDTIRLYVTLPGQADAWFLAAEVPNSTTGPVNINVGPNELVLQFDETNSTPPGDDRLVDFCIFDDRMHVTDGDTIWSSQYTRYETFDASDDGIPVSSEDGHKIKCIFPHNRKMIVGKVNSIHTFTPTGAGDYFPGILSDKRGMRSKFAAKSDGQVLVFYDGFTFCRSDNFGEPVDISSDKLQDILKAIPSNRRDDLVAEMFPRQNLYVVTVPQPDDDFIILAYNYKKRDENAWSVFEFQGRKIPTFLAEGFGRDGSREIYGIMGVIDSPITRVVELLDEESDDDYGGEIEYEWKSKAFTAENPQDYVELEDVLVGAANEGVVGEIAVYRDLNPTADSTQEINHYDPSFGPDNLTWASLNTKDRTANFLQVGWSFSGVLSKTFRFTSLILNLFQKPGHRRAQKGGF